MASKKGKKDSGSGTGIPPLVDDCIEQIRLRGLHEDGILRVSGSAAQIKELQNTYRKGKRADLSTVYIHTVGGVLKNFFRDMPTPVMTFELYDDIIACTKIAEEEKKLERLREIIKQLPMENQEILHKILVFVREVSQYSDENQMTIQNLATMFGPTLLRKKEQDRAELLNDLQDVIAITHVMLANKIFENWPDNVDKHPNRPAEPELPPKEKQKKVRAAVTTWYGSQKWTKEVKGKGNARKSGVASTHSTPTNGGDMGGPSDMTVVATKSEPAMPSTPVEEKESMELSVAEEKKEDSGKEEESENLEKSDEELENVEKDDEGNNEDDSESTERLDSSESSKSADSGGEESDDGS